MYSVSWVYPLANTELSTLYLNVQPLWLAGAIPVLSPVYTCGIYSYP
ncbi:hypothetical protein phiKDA1_01A (endogenous virus) [Enterobacter phage phiKDA1]|uniref:Uncharacterized protein n=1 Tax=Enterobacter phage phiKDA1 TaxID=1147139 RepID=A0A0A6Z563_9CAUD|nr:hypothetical protein HOQ86_gp01 [Enterobacter phage phiKDA1]AFE86094.1 hypothetical protein phiKDA1_01A [Enterobacter phage phiKDA1]